MKILRDTPDELVLESRPWRLGLGLIALYLFILWAAFRLIGNGGIIGGVAMIVIGAAFVAMMFHFFIRLEKVRFSRTDACVQIRRTGLRGHSAETVALETIERAIVQTYDHGDSGPTHRTALALRADARVPTVPLTLAYFAGGGAKRAATRINDWLAGRHA